MKVLIVDDEKDILEFLSYNLEKEGFIVHTALNGKSAIEKAKKYKPDLIILDVMMPEMDGITTCQEIRSIPEISNTLILFLTARSEEYSELAGFDAGADDYVAKPIKPKLLISRIKAILKRNKIKASTKNIQIGNIEIDREKFLLLYNKEEIHMARKEFNLLYYLMTIPGKVFTREDIISEIWKDAFVGDRTIDVHVRKIREKIGDKYIKTVKGVGYKFDL
ncbi:MAG: response regulator transcription factor [Gammaproteobacteria bacterium]|nr:response regulator transcription factor [Gammaproteobacteria bacterium]